MIRIYKKYKKSESLSLKYFWDTPRSKDLYILRIFYFFIFSTTVSSLSRALSSSSHGRISSPLFIILCVSNSNFLFRPFFPSLTSAATLRDTLFISASRRRSTVWYRLCPRGRCRREGRGITRVLEKAFRRYAGKIRVSSRVHFLNERNAIYAPAVRREKGGNALTKVYASVQTFRLSQYIRVGGAFVDAHSIYMYYVCILRRNSFSLFSSSDNNAHNLCVGAAIISIEQYVYNVLMECRFISAKCRAIRHRNSTYSIKVALLSLRFMWPVGIQLILIRKRNFAYLLFITLSREFW